MHRKCSNKYDIQGNCIEEDLGFCFKRVAWICIQIEFGLCGDNYFIFMFVFLEMCKILKARHYLFRAKVHENELKSLKIVVKNWSRV